MSFQSTTRSPGVKQTLSTHGAWWRVRGDTRFLLGLLTRWQALLSGDKATWQPGVTGRECRCITAVPLGQEWHPVNPKRHPRCAGCTLSATDNSAVYIRRGERQGLNSRFHTRHNANRPTIAVNNRVQKRKQIFYIYVRGFKFTKKKIWFFFFFFQMFHIHILHYGENYSERHIIKILCKGIYHIK